MRARSLIMPGGKRRFLASGRRWLQWSQELYSSLRQAAVGPPRRLAVKVDMRIALLLWLSSVLHAQTASPQPPRTVHSEDVVTMAAIFGVVLDASGKPYAGAQIWTAAASVPPHPETSLDGYATDAQGRFRLTVAPGSYLVCAFPPGVGLDETKMALPTCFPSAPAYTAATAVTVVPQGASPQLTIRLLEALTYSIRGRITSGHVLKTKHWGMTIDAESDHPQQHLGCGLFLRVPYSSACATGYAGDVKADGSFVISGVPAGSYALDATAGDGVGRQIVANGDLGMRQPTSVPPVYTGARKVIVKGNLSGVPVKVKLEVNDHAPQR